MDAAQLQKITGYFILEAQEHIEVISESLQNFQVTVNDPEQIHEIYRGAHSIKGGAAMLDFESIRFTAHRLEDYFKFLKNNPLTIDATLTNNIKQVFGSLEQQITTLEAQQNWSTEQSNTLLAQLRPLCEQTMSYLEALAAGKTPLAQSSGTEQLTEPTKPASVATSEDELEVLLSEFDTSPGMEAEDLSNLLNAFDTHPSIPEPSAPVSPDNAIANELDELFGDAALDELNTDPPPTALTPQLDEELLTIGSPQVELPPGRELDTMHDLFGGNFSFEESTSNAVTANIPTHPPQPNASKSEDVEVDLNQELDDLFGGLEDLDTHTVLNQGLATEAATVEPELALPPTADPTAHQPFQAETDFDDLLAIGNSGESSPHSVTEPEFDPFGTLGDQAANELATFESADEPPEATDAMFDQLLEDATTDAEDLNGLTAFLSGEEPLSTPPSAMADLDELDSLLGNTGDRLTADDITDLEAFLSGDNAALPSPKTDAATPDSMDELFATVEKPSSTPDNDLASLLSESDTSEVDMGLDDLFAASDAAALTEATSTHNLDSHLDAELPSTDNADEFTDLDDLLAAAEQNGIDISPAEPAQAEPSLTDEDLTALFIENAPLPISNGQTASSASSPAAESLCYYESWDALDHLIEQPIQDLANLPLVTNFAALEQLLTQPPGIGNAEMVAQPSPAPDMFNAPSPSPVEGGDDFDDLEAMVVEMRQKAGELTPDATTARRPNRAAKPRKTKPKVEATLKVPVRQMDNLNNLVGELVVNRNSLEGDEERLRQFLDNLMHQVQNLNDVGSRMQDLYERSLLEDALLRSRREYRAKQTGDFPSVPGTQTTLPGHTETKGEFDELEMDSFTKFHELAQETIEMIVRVRESTSDIQFLVDDIDQVARTLRQVTSQIQEGLNKSRMIPFGNTASRLPLAVRRIAPQLNKQANLELEGQETLIDKMILEHLSDPLTHLVNNALTHGIELPEIRLASGKSQVGNIRVTALQQGNQTVISVADDGAGIDPERVKNKAVQKGLLTVSQASQMDELEIYDLLFHAGFSTKDQADNFAGRGVGLDVVRTSINEIRGTVTIDSKMGKGTTFTIRLPLTLTVGKALCCISEGAPIAFSLDGVEDMVDVPQTKVRRNAQGQLCLPWRDALLPYHPLSSLLSYNRRIGRGSFYGGKRDDNVLSVVILRGGESNIAIGVDQVIGEQEIVIKQLQGPVPKPPGIAGATVQGDGTIMAIADVLELIELSQGRLRKDGPVNWQDASKRVETPESIVRTESVVLIVDDSITVRELLSMTFSKAGYRVEQARDGLDAWEKLRAGLPCDIIFCDIEMPRLDGLELLGRLADDEELAKIPIAMLTSRGAERHRRVAAELGAAGYFTKPYLEDVLLDGAQRMIAGDVLLENSTRQPQQLAKEPIQPAAAAMSTSVTLGDPMDMHQEVLIIDDSVTVRSLLSMTFEKAGYTVEQSRDGKEAWEKLKGGLTPDLIFCDIEMPRMDGLELLGNIYEDAEIRRIPVAMLTSRGAERHRRIAAERGASGYFTKPYVEQDLLAAAERMRQGEVLLKNSVREPGITTRGSNQPSTSPAPTTSDDPQATMVQVEHSEPTVSVPEAQFDRPPKVLIIDDSITVRSLLTMTFEKAGYVVEQARDGKEALEKLQGGIDPDLAFCDIEMPKMDGLTLLNHLQGDANLKGLPVAMLTSRGAKKHKIAAAERGARGYFTKPYVEDVLLDAAQRLMRGEMLLTVEA
ncbi:MAG: response regulator [Spirulina sp. SIO3F2]|nr:response regulator [Spirulina sp. SIO3F2]